jgi:HSP20 family molecular chaperone IbpA
MTRMTPFSSPLLLGFDTMERTLERLAKSGDSYPPYNIERLRDAEGAGERLRITLAVAGFSECDLEVTTEENQLLVAVKAKTKTMPSASSCIVASPGASSSAPSCWPTG